MMRKKIANPIKFVLFMTLSLILTYPGLSVVASAHTNLTENPNLSVVASADTNLIANPGFENGSTTPDDWETITSDGNSPIWDTASHNGSRSIQINVLGTTKVPSSGFAKLSNINASPSNQYNFSAWGKTSDLTGTAVVYLVEAANNSIWYKEHGIVFREGTEDWEKKEISFIADSNTTYFYVVIKIEYGYGAFWVDDINLSTPPPSPDANLILNPTPALTPAPTSALTPALTPELTPALTSAQAQTPALTSAPTPALTSALTPTPTSAPTPTPTRAQTQTQTQTQTPPPAPAPNAVPTKSKVAIGNWGYGSHGYLPFQNDPRLTWDMVVDPNNIRPNVVSIWEKPMYSGSIPQTNFKFVQSRFDLATQNKDKGWTYGTYLLLEELFHPAVRAQWFSDKESLKTWDIEGTATFAGVNIMHLKPWYIEQYGAWNQAWWDGVKADNHFNDPKVWKWSVYYGYNLHKAWNLHMKSLGKKSAITGIIGADAGSTKYLESDNYPSPMLEYVMANYDLIFTYQYPDCVSGCSRPVSQSLEEVKMLREKYNYKGKLVHTLTSDFPTGAGTSDENVQFEEFKAVYPYVDAIIVQPYANLQVTPNQIPNPPRLIKFYNSVNP